MGFVDNGVKLKWRREIEVCGENTKERIVVVNVKRKAKNRYGIKSLT
jgi:hypothetical protein